MLIITVYNWLNKNYYNFMLFYQGENILNLVTLSITKVFNYSITDVFDVFVDICFII